MDDKSTQIILPEKVSTLIAVITKAGYEAYAVGGCVRDSLLGRTPDDWDITTSATPQQIKELFRRTVDTGIRHGTVTVLMDKEGFEVTTYRIDGEYEDSRHPKEVTFTFNLIEDLKRRDFTINAMAYNDASGLIDRFGGALDMDRKMICCVGDPEERFAEDALRIMRAVRFSAQLGYFIEEHTKKAVCKMADSLKNISAERIRTELIKLLLSSHPDYMRICWETGVTRAILPEFDICMETEQNHPHHCYSVGEHILHALAEAEPDKVLRLTMLFHDIGKPVSKTTDDKGIDHFHGHAAAGAVIAENVMRRLKFDNDTLGKVIKLVSFHGIEIESTPPAVRRAVSKVGEELFPLLLLVKRADVYAQSQFKRKEKLSEIKEIEEIYIESIKAQDCLSLRTLAVSGSDLISAGMKPGKKLGQTLQRLLEVVLENPSMNQKDILISYVLAADK